MALEIQIALIGLAGAIVGGAISSVTTLIIARGERSKFRRERSWDLRREAYTVIIGALDRARAIAEYIADHYRDDPHAWDASAGNRQAQTEMVEHFQVARTAVHSSRLVLSKAFVARYDEMNRRLAEGNNPNLLPPESAEIAANVMREAVPEMEGLAIRELGMSA